MTQPDDTTTYYPGGLSDWLRRYPPQPHKTYLLKRPYKIPNRILEVEVSR